MDGKYMNLHRFCFFLLDFFLLVFFLCAHFTLANPASFALVLSSYFPCQTLLPLPLPFSSLWYFLLFVCSLTPLGQSHPIPPYSTPLPSIHPFATFWSKVLCWLLLFSCKSDISQKKKCRNNRIQTKNEIREIRPTLLPWERTKRIHLQESKESPRPFRLVPVTHHYTQHTLHTSYMQDKFCSCIVCYVLCRILWTWVFD